MAQPPTVEVGMVRQGQSAGEQAMARICGPMPVGQTLIRNGEVYTLHRHPTQDQLDEADKFWLGGHEYDDAELDAYLAGL